MYGLDYSNFAFVIDLSLKLLLIRIAIFFMIFLVRAPCN